MASRGESIRYYRYRKGLSLKDLADLTGLNNSYLSKIERGLHQGSARTLKLIALALDVDVDDILDMKESA